MSARKPLFPGRRFSFLRLGIALISAALIVAGVWGWLTYTQTASKKLPAPWFGGYADVTSTPSYTFESDVGSAYNNVILSFITAPDGCTPTWGGYYSLNEASSQLDIDSRIAHTFRANRTVTISFGGQQGTELARQCTTVSSLKKAYQTVISRYHVTSIDFDIENDNLDGYSESAVRRAQAVAEIQDEMESRGQPLTVSLTLPASTSGLTSDGLDTVSSFIDAGVNLSTLNLMTMDFNIPSNVTAQSELIKKALNAGHKQYKQLLYSKRKLFSDSQIWEMMGATVLIGQNDTDNEYLTLDDAQRVNTFAMQTNLGHLAMWSLNRDQQCGENSVTQTIQTGCSGMKQNAGEFATLLSSGFKGTPGTIVDMDSATWSTPSGKYEQWNVTTEYTEGDKVVWKHNLYEALSDNTGEQPDSTASGADSPWRLIGPA